MAAGPYTSGDRLGNLYFASKTAEFYRDRIEFPFFMERLKDKKDQPLAQGRGLPDRQQPVARVRGVAPAPGGASHLLLE